MTFTGKFRMYILCSAVEKTSYGEVEDQEVVRDEWFEYCD